MSNIFRISAAYYAFWDNDSEDKPHPDFIKNLRMSSIDDLINITSTTTANIIRQTKGIVDGYNFFKVYNIKTGESVYYILKSVEYVGEEYTKYNLELDIWSTHCIGIIEQLEQPFQFVRTPIINENAFLYNDPLTNDIPIVYDTEDESVILEEFEEDAEKTSYIYDRHKIENQVGFKIIVTKKNSTLGNLYYIFKGVNNNLTYECFPLLNTTEQSQLEVWNAAEEGLINNLSYNWSWSNGRWRGRDEAITAYNNFAYYNTITSMESHVWGYQKYATFTNPQESDPFHWTVGNRDRPFSKNLNYKGIYKAHVPVAIIPVVDFYFNIQGTTNHLLYSHYKIDNTEIGLERLKNNASYVNKFMGIYFLPNFAKFTDNPKVLENCAYYEMAAKGVPMNLDLGSTLINTTLPTIKNQPYFNNIKMLKYYNISYYGILKNWNMYLNETKDRIKFDSLFLFNGNGIYLGTSEFEKTRNSIIEMPSQLPAATDDYVKYYSSSQSSVNTGLQQMREQQNHALANNFFDSANSFGANAVMTATNPVAGGIGMLNSAGGMLRKGGEILRSTRHAKERLTASYADAKRVMGTSFATTNAADASYIHTNFKINVSAGEVVEIAIPSLDSMRLLNNINYFYGEYCPTFLTFTEVLNSFKKFGFIQNDAENLNMTILNNRIFWTIPADYRNYFINTFSKGVRLWKVEPWSPITAKPKTGILI